MARVADPIFLIEDDASIREDLAELLELEGYAVTAFANGREGLDGLRSAATLPKLVLLDLMMPVMNGYEVLEALHAAPELARLPVLVLSADGRADLQLPRDRGLAFMRKPLDVGAFLALVRRLTR